MARTFAERTAQDPALAGDAFAAALLPILTSPAGTTTLGFPYLAPAPFARLRDTIPHVLGMGPRALAAVERVRRAAERTARDDEASDAAAMQNLGRAAAVVRGVVNTAAITAPSDLWLLRHVVGVLRQAGVVERLLAGARVDPRACDVVVGGAVRRADARELDADLGLLLARGYLSVDDGVYSVAPHPRARAVLSTLGPLPATWPVHAAALWADVFAGRSLCDDDDAGLRALAASAPARNDVAQDTWIATAEEIDLGHRLLPIVLGLRAAAQHTVVVTDGAGALKAFGGDLVRAAVSVLVKAGVLDEEGRATPVGERVLLKGAGPMGIIEAYHTYMARLPDILVEGRGASWVARGTNVAASQDANRATFEKANDALDAFAQATGFTPRVFIEHAIGRGEATRQRFVRAGEEAMRYFGADLEDAAIDAALVEQQAGRLPKNLVLLRHVDIGDPQRLVDALREANVDTRDAVMIVGNGFHEVRGQTDEKMVEVFRGYQEAGIVLSFTEESALSTDDLLATAWNTYHAGFKYVHEKSGQGLRPADPSPPTVVGKPLRASWMECATRAGYVRLEQFSSRSRSIYPTLGPGGHNPSVSMNHFCVPRALYARLEGRL